MNQCHVRHQLPHLVRLQMANEMPFYVLRQHGAFCGQLLHVALAEDALSGIVCLLNGLCRVEFGHSHELRALRQLGCDGSYLVGYHASAHSCF